MRHLSSVLILSFLASHLPASELAFRYDLEKPQFSNVVLFPFFALQRYKMKPTNTYVRETPCAILWVQNLETKKKYFAKSTKEVVHEATRKGEVDGVLGEVTLLNLPPGDYAIIETHLWLPKISYTSTYRSSGGQSIETRTYFPSFSTTIFPVPKEQYLVFKVGPTGVHILPPQVQICDGALFEPFEDNSPALAVLSALGGGAGAPYYRSIKEFNSTYVEKNTDLIGKKFKNEIYTLTNAIQIQQWRIENNLYVSGVRNVESANDAYSNQAVERFKSKVQNSPWRAIVDSFFPGT